MKAINNLQLTIYKKGFTLIELLVAIGIIGILSGFLLANFVGVRQRVRDGQRKFDLQEIRSALELYRADQGKYIDNETNSNHTFLGFNCIFGSSSFKGGSPPITYMQRIPCDPILLGTGKWNYGSYYYSSPDGATYTLGACLENGNDTDINDVLVDPAGGNFWSCGSGKWYVLKNP